MSGEPGAGERARLAAVEELIAAVGARADVARAFEPSTLDRLLRSIVEATAALFDAEAASIALVEDDGRLRFRAAAGQQGSGVVGLFVAPGEGIAGYVQASGQPLALSDVAADPRFKRDAAEASGYLPRSILAVPLELDDRVVGVLEVLDKRDAGGFDLADIARAGVFARQAAVAIDVSRVDRGVVRLLTAGLAAIAAGAASEGRAETGAGIDDLVGEALAALDEPAPGFWAAVDRLAELRGSDPARLALIVDVLDVAIGHPASRATGVPRSGSTSWRDRAGLSEAD